MTISDEKKELIISKVTQSVNSYGNGLELVEVKFYMAYGKLNISILIWKKDGITLDDCESFHNFVFPAFDEIDDLFDEDYVLNVCSQGLDRLIVSNDDFRRALDTEIEIFTSDKTKKHGILVSYSDVDVVIKNDKEKEIKINRKNITKVQPYISF